MTDKAWLTVGLATCGVAVVLLAASKREARHQAADPRTQAWQEAQRWGQGIPGWSQAGELTRPASGGDDKGGAFFAAGTAIYGTQSDPTWLGKLVMGW